MATEAQKNFRKEVKELLRERKSAHLNKTNSYIKEASFDKKAVVGYIRKRLIAFSGVVIIVFLSVYFFSIIVNVFNQATSNKEKPIIIYIEKIIVFDNQLVRINQSVNGYTNKLDMKSSDSRKKFVNSMNLNLNLVKSILNKIVMSNEPKELKEYKKNTIKRYENFYNGINFYILGVSKNNRENLKNAVQAFRKFNNDITDRNSNLIDVFKKYKIEFQIQKDGSIRFWYNI
jgi:hypothetical protein